MDGAGFRQTNVNGQAQIYRVFQNTSGQIAIQFYPIPLEGTYQVFIVSQDAALTTIVLALTTRWGGRSVSS
jgi:hypothetical protein